MQSDGNLVVYDATHSALWASGTDDNPGASLELNALGAPIIDSAVGSPLWSPGFAGPEPMTLLPGSRLTPGEFMASRALPCGQVEVVMQGDGNLVEYAADGAPVWASGTFGIGTYAAMQGDGNLVVYDGGGHPLWASGTDGNPGAALVIGSAGQLALRSTTGISLWASPTGSPGLAPTPSGLSAEAGDGTLPDHEAVVSWTPSQPSDVDIWGFVVVVNPGGNEITAGGSATSAIVTGLTDGVSYRFEVSAIDSAGQGLTSWPPSNAVVPRPSPVPPGPPTGVQAVPGSSQVQVSWSAPVDTGGTPITGYDVTVSPGGASTTVSAGALTATIGGLANGLGVHATVTAVNRLGPGALSLPSALATPAFSPFPVDSSVAPETVPGDWPMYNKTIAASDWNTAESAISPATALSMTTTAMASGLGDVQSSMPIVAFGRVFVGAMTGDETSLAVSNLAQQWSTFLGTDGPVASCPGSYPYGVVGAPTTATVGSTNVLFVSGGDTSLYALDATTGAILWRTQLAQPPDSFSFVSPLLYDGSLYTGIASYGDCPLVQGEILQDRPSNRQRGRRIQHRPRWMHRRRTVGVSERRPVGSHLFRHRNRGRGLSRNRRRRSRRLSTRDVACRGRRPAEPGRLLAPARD